ncbi:dihydromonapterin reductase [Pseudoalteromonas luteoviolacea]|uniref:Dihydromonapterin reductase n=1 Tax=Pseudoalteromonas luteoviolacea H33 TaxID=1365251 RepID=A0A167FH90_9GAMM|nr:dihydromonapterin reductase [Pseudoalteromonas luteoviolacea]KZN52278.1 dihydromonapterin reductase [Pseudoalteromonas luteoviolacea H33]KZN75779.1 dihydromonapterin reductase [Pseudoalteromonas luteoviolacea H33-S]MBQ4879198.1 dihydromonapterin reductase [Pseudoalteromonas luteoviolacea]MBQ4908258.1 dihydromonapterin reductase [Pseudoalteromonas luteoviolacea]
MAAPILITGGAQRIGLALAKHFISADIPLIVTYRTRHNSVDELEANGVTCIQVDFNEPDAIAQLVEKITEHTNALRAVIHNASSWDCEKLNPDHNALFDNMMRIHAKVPYLLNMALAPLLQASNEVSDIVHITDYVAEKGSPKHIAYAASKAALDNLSRSFAAKYAPNIKVNSVSPSLIIFNEHDDEAYKAKTLQKSLMGIEPGCQEVIASIELLLNSNYITGRTLAVDGGRHLK